MSVTIVEPGHIRIKSEPFTADVQLLGAVTNRAYNIVGFRLMPSGASAPVGLKLGTREVTSLPAGQLIPLTSLPGERHSGALNENLKASGGAAGALLDGDVWYEERG